MITKKYSKNTKRRMQQRGPKAWKIITHLILIILLSDIVIKRSKKVYNVTKVTRFLPDLRYILLWHNISVIEDDGQGTAIRRKCEYTNCYFTSNRTLFGNLGYFDAILFNAIEVSAGSWDLPSVRTRVQKYVFVANDSSDNYPVCDSVYDTFFNWTWTYKVESTIPYTHFTIHNLHDEDLGNYFEWKPNMTSLNRFSKAQLAAKSKAVAIFLNKCKSRSKREVFIKNLEKQLAKYNLTVDVFGDCGTKKCKKRGCFWRLKKYYYFYLAMEDSIADNYITQEVVIAYENNAVPIVYGGAGYDRVLPPNSYLNAIKLNEKRLARTMNAIIKNRTLYYDFFRWKNHYVVKGKETNPMDPCELCKALNNPKWLTFKTKNFGFRKWWNPRYRDRCSEA